jgi:hypothetical protein
MQTQSTNRTKHHQLSGPAHPRAKLTTAQVDEMRDIYESGGVGYGYLAEIFGCGISTARDIVKYRTRWAG